MEHHWLVALPSIWVVALVSPGPDALALAQTAASSGRRSGFACAAGIGTGMAAWAAAAMGGLAVLFAEAAWLYRLVVLAGAAYLLVTGLRLLVLAAKSDGAGKSSAAIHPARPRPATPLAAFRRGLLTNLSNPKAAVLFGSVFAVTMPPDTGPEMRAALVLGASLSAALWYVLLAQLLSGAAVRAAYRRAERGVAAAAGACFAGFGAALVWREAR